MAINLGLILLLSLTVFTQADIVEDAVNFIQDFAEKSLDAKKNMKSLALSGKEAMEHNFATLKSQSHEETLMSVLKAKDLAEKHSCNDAHTQLDELVGTVGNRWDDCFNFTQSILNFTEFVVRTAENFENVELLFCNGIQNISSCEGSFIEKWECVTQDIKVFIEEIENNSGDFTSLIEAINDYIIEVIKQATTCFTGVSFSVSNEIKNVMLEKCKISLNDVKLE